MDTTVLSAFELSRSPHVVTDESNGGPVVLAVMQGSQMRQMTKAEFNLWNPVGGGITGTPGQIVYFNAGGNPTGDSFFTRDPVTKAVNIQVSGASSNSSIAITDTIAYLTLGYNSGAGASISLSDSGGGYPNLSMYSTDGVGGNSQLMIDSTAGVGIYNAITGNWFYLPKGYTNPGDNGKTFVLDSSTGQLSWGITVPVLAFTAVGFGDAGNQLTGDAANFSYDSVTGNFLVGKVDFPQIITDAGTQSISLQVGTGGSASISISGAGLFSATLPNGSSITLDDNAKTFILNADNGTQLSSLKGGGDAVVGVDNSGNLSVLANYATGTVTITAADLAGKTMTFVNGILTSFA